MPISIFSWVAAVRMWRAIRIEPDSGIVDPVVLAQPLRVLVRPVEIVRGFVEFVLPLIRCGRGSAKQLSDVVLAHGLKTTDRIESLLKNWERFAACNHHASRQVHGIVQTLNGRCRLAAKDDAVAHGFHAEHTYIVLHKHREYFLFETVIVCVHDIEWHLNGVEGELVSESCLQHF